MTADPVDGWYPIQVGEVNGWVCGDYVTRGKFLFLRGDKEEEQKRMEAEEAAAAEAGSRSPGCRSGGSVSCVRAGSY